MKNPLRTARRREQYHVAATDAPATRGFDRAESRRLTEWLRAKGEPVLHPWRRKGPR